MKAGNRLIVFTVVLAAVAVIFAVPYFKNDIGEKEKTKIFSITQQPAAKIDEAIKKGKPVYIEFYGKT